MWWLGVCSLCGRCECYYLTLLEGSNFWVLGKTPSLHTCWECRHAMTKFSGCNQATLYMCNLAQKCSLQGKTTSRLGPAEATECVRSISFAALQSGTDCVIDGKFWLLGNRVTAASCRRCAGSVRYLILAPPSPFALSFPSLLGTSYLLYPFALRPV